MVSGVARDPAGMLERVPELAALAEKHVTVRSAIERGKPHAVYYALLRLKLFGAGADKQLVSDLLRHRRLFIQPLGRAPTMITYNGIGARVYGQAEPDGEDASHIKTLFFVVLFVPLYPLSAYLVKKADGRGWTFYGRVPLSAPSYLWQRACAAVGILAVLVGAYRAVWASRYNTVWVANALPTAVEVRLGTAPPLVVLPHAREKMRARVGMQPLEVREGGRVLEHGQLEVKRGYDVVLWNVIGAGLVYEEDVIYTAKRSDGPGTPPTPAIFCGDNQVLLDNVPYVFTEPPKNISMGESEKVVHKNSLGFASDEPLGCLRELEKRHRHDELKTLAEKLAEATRYDQKILAASSSALVADGQASAAVDLLKKGLAQPNASIELHRMYQELAQTAGLPRAALIEEYHARALAQPDSADATYLWARLLVDPESGRAFADALQRFPKHPYLLRAAAYEGLRQGEFARVAQLMATLHDADLKIWRESYDLQVRALTGLGRIDQARNTADEYGKDPDLDLSDRIELASKQLLLSRFEPNLSESTVLQTLHMDSDEGTAAARLRARAEGGADVTAVEIADEKDEVFKSSLTVEVNARKNPTLALDKLVSADEPPHISMAAWALLLAEAARLDAKHSALARLRSPGYMPYSASTLDAIADYVRDGKPSDELGDLDAEMLAAFDFVRSRNLSGAERETLRSRAAREDPLHGAVTMAMNSWPQ